MQFSDLEHFTGTKLCGFHLTIEYIDYLEVIDLQSTPLHGIENMFILQFPSDLVVVLR